MNDDFDFAVSSHLLPLRVLLEGASVTALGLRYASDDLAVIEEDAQDSMVVDVSVDPSDLSHVLVFHPFDEVWIKVPCEDHRYARGLSLRAHAERGLGVDPALLEEVSCYVAFRMEGGERGQRWW